MEYKPQFPDDPYPLDSIYEIPDGEYCTVHNHGILIPPINEELTEDPLEDDDGIPEGQPPAEDIGEPIEEQNWDGIDWDEGNPNSD